MTRRGGGLSEGGIPIGSALVAWGPHLVGARPATSESRRADPVLHAEIDCFRNAGRVGYYGDTTLYSTLMPCYLCAGAAVQFGIKRVVVGRVGDVWGRACLPRVARHPRCSDLALEECKDLMRWFIAENPALVERRHRQTDGDAVTHAEMDALLRQYGRLVVCLVVRAQGSVPRQAGGADGRPAGRADSRGRSAAACSSRWSRRTRGAALGDGGERLEEVRFPRKGGVPGGHRRGLRRMGGDCSWRSSPCRTNS